MRIVVITTIVLSGIGVSRMTFGRFVRKEMTDKEIGLREMARKIGVSATYLSQLGRDEVKPTVEMVGMIANILQCDAKQLQAIQWWCSNGHDHRLRNRKVSEVF
jgi:transcriptional regulator with XRE-family HTH domain